MKDICCGIYGKKIAKLSRFTFEKCRKVQETKMQNGNGLVQNLTKKTLETNQIASCK